MIHGLSSGRYQALGEGFGKGENGSRESVAGRRRRRGEVDQINLRNLYSRRGIGDNGYCTIQWGLAVAPFSLLIGYYFLEEVLH